ncbi:hypothetical protein AB0C90_38750 [Streptomyces sp. NPDC048550]|uniref:hypothetical protein n=1 Tax=Streptomyces sp. NPDC048550 TaxID=3155739 RepID=UPI003432AEF1
MGPHRPALPARPAAATLALTAALAVLAAGLTAAAPATGFKFVDLGKVRDAVDR